MTSKKPKVAILTIVPGGTHGEIIRGLYKANEESKRQFTPISFHTHSTRPLSIQLQLAQIVEGDYKLIVAIDDIMAYHALCYMKEHKKEIPIICCNTLRHTDTSLIRGMSVEVDPPLVPRALLCLLRIKPLIKKVLMPSRFNIEKLSEYDPALTLWERTYILPAKSFLERHDIEPLIPYGETVSAMYEGSAGFIPSTQAVILLEGSPLLDLHLPFIFQCNKYKVPLFACCSSAIKDGAAFGYTMPLENIGKQVTHIIQQALFEEIDTKTIPVFVQSVGRYLIVHRANSEKQGLDGKTALEGWRGGYMFV